MKTSDFIAGFVAFVAVVALAVVAVAGERPRAGHLPLRGGGQGAVTDRAARRLDAITRAVRALAGLDAAALDAVTYHGMVDVLCARGWVFIGPRVLDGQWAAERFEHGTALGGLPLPAVWVPSLRLDDWGARVVDWATATARRHGDVAPAELLADALEASAT